MVYLLNMRTIINLCLDLEPYDIKIEKNMGHGTVEALFLAEIEKMRNEGIIQESFPVSSEAKLAVPMFLKRRGTKYEVLEHFGQPFLCIGSCDYTTIILHTRSTHQNLCRTRDEAVWM